MSCLQKFRMSLISSCSDLMSFLTEKGSALNTAEICVRRILTRSASEHSNFELRSRFLRINEEMRYLLERLGREKVSDDLREVGRVETEESEAELSVFLEILTVAGLEIQPGKFI